MEKKFGKLVSNVGKNAKDILEKSKNKAVQIADQNDDGKFDLEDVTAMANSVEEVLKGMLSGANGDYDIKFEWQ